MNLRTSKTVRLAALIFPVAVAALMGACANDGHSDMQGFGANRPNWHNNGTTNSGSSTAGPEGDAGRPFDENYDRNINGSWWNNY